MTERSLGRRPLWTVVALLGVAAAALWISSLLVWNWRVEPAGASSVVHPLRGAEVEPALVGLALVALASVAAVLATGGWPRRAVGALVAAGGVGALVLALANLFEPRTLHVTGDGFERWLDQVQRWNTQAAVGVGLTALAGLLLTVGGAIVVASGHRMPRMGSRYQQPAARRKAPDRMLWDELDAGRDPTSS